MKNISWFVTAMLLIVIGCEMKTYTLQNGRTKVPADSIAYKNISKFDTTLLAIVDTGVVYEEYRPEKKILSRLDTGITTSIYGVIRFYSNGYYNHFYINRNNTLDSNDFNPSYNGKRGVYFKQGNLIRYDLYAESNQLGHIGLLTGTFIFSNDTLYMYAYSDYLKRPSIYVKRKIPYGYLNYSVNW